MLDRCDPIPTQQKISASRVEVAELILICNYDHPSERKTLKSWDLKKGQSLIHYKKKKDNLSHHTKVSRNNEHLL